jgi:glycerate-2-kinase
MSPLGPRQARTQRLLRATLAVPDPTTLADARALVARYGLTVDDAVRRALNDAANESCKPGDAAFARAGFELIARPRGSLDAAIKVAVAAGYEIIDLGADLEGEDRSIAAEHAQLALQARAGSTGRHSLRRRAYRDRARHWARRT